MQQSAKLVLLGEMGSGKSSLLTRFVKGEFFTMQVRARAGPRERHRACVRPARRQLDFPLCS